MKNSVLYIVGALALLGGGAFLFLKNKKSKDASKLADFEKATLTPQGQATTPSTGAPSMGEFPAPQTQAPTPQVALQSAQEIEANGLATQIFGLKTQKSVLDSQKDSTPLSGTSVFGSNTNVQYLLLVSRISVLNKKITDLQSKIKALGYKEVDGKAVKLVAVTTTQLV